MSKFNVEFKKVSQFGDGSEIRHVKAEVDESGLMKLISDINLGSSDGIADLQLLSVRKKTEPKPKPVKSEVKK
jgi:hypothetical protein